MNWRLTSVSLGESFLAFYRNIHLINVSFFSNRNQLMQTMPRSIFAIQSLGISMDSDISFASNLPEIYILWVKNNFLSSYNTFLASFLSWKDQAINAFFRAFQTSYEKATFGAKYKEMPDLERPKFSKTAISKRRMSVKIYAKRQSKIF